MPVTPVCEFTSRSVQTPGTQLPAAFLKSTEWPARFASWPPGWYVPVNGAVPALMGFSAVSPKTVLTKLEPLPPTPEKRGTCVPSGAISVALRAESTGNAALSWTVSLATWKVPLKLGTVSVEFSVPEGIVWPTLSDAKYCGPETEPADPMIWSTCAG